MCVRLWTNKTTRFKGLLALHCSIQKSAINGRQAIAYVLIPLPDKNNGWISQSLILVPNACWFPFVFLVSCPPLSVLCLPVPCLATSQRVSLEVFSSLHGPFPFSPTRWTNSLGQLANTAPRVFAKLREHETPPPSPYGTSQGAQIVLVNV